MAGKATQGSRARKAPATDATGREKERLEAANRPAMEAAATQVAMTTGPIVEEVEEVVDYSGGGGPSADEAEAGVRLISLEEAIGDGQTAHTVDDLPAAEVDISSLPDGKTDVRPEQVKQLDEPQPAAAPVVRPPVATPGTQTAVLKAPVVEEQYRIMRVNTDLPDVTIGKDNHFIFRENTRYKVPQFVYDHLDEKGYVWH